MTSESKLETDDECEALLAPSGESFSHDWKGLSRVYTTNYADMCLSPQSHVLTSCAWTQAQSWYSKKPWGGVSLHLLGANNVPRIKEQRLELPLQHGPVHR